MRLWHYKLISVLPNKMLVSQWRECIAIKRQWEKGGLKHRLVNYVMNYDKYYFYNYIYLITLELDKRAIQYKWKYVYELKKFCSIDDLSYRCLFYKEHNNRYLRQCYYNLEEKADRGIITDKELMLVQKVFKRKD